MASASTLPPPILPQELTGAKDASKGLYYTLKLDGDKVEDIYINKQEQGVQNFSMNIYIANREWLIDTINEAFMRGAISLERDILIPHLDTYKVMAYEHKGYVARITGLKSYFDENMKLLDDKNLSHLLRSSHHGKELKGDEAFPVFVAKGQVV